MRILDKEFLGLKNRNEAKRSRKSYKIAYDPYFNGYFCYRNDQNWRFLLEKSLSRIRVSTTPETFISWSISLAFIGLLLILKGVS